MTMIVIATNRFRLRRMEDTDLDFLGAILGHPDVMTQYPKLVCQEETFDWYHKTLGSYERVACMIRPENHASLKVANGLGML